MRELDLIDVNQQARGAEQPKCSGGLRMLKAILRLWSERRPWSHGSAERAGESGP